MIQQSTTLSLRKFVSHEEIKSAFHRESFTKYMDRAFAEALGEGIKKIGPCVVGRVHDVEEEGFEFFMDGVVFTRSVEIWPLTEPKGDERLYMDVSGRWFR
jgi:hypothetical protein